MIYRPVVVAAAFALAVTFRLVSQSNAGGTIDPKQNAICDAMAAQIVDALGASVADRSDRMFYLAIGDLHDIHFICDRTNSLRQFDGIEISYNERGTPPASWWTILGRAGEAYSGREHSDVVELAKTCLEDAGRESSNLGQVTSNQIHIECNSGSKPGTSIYVRIYPEQAN